MNKKLFLSFLLILSAAITSLIIFSEKNENLSEVSCKQLSYNESLNLHPKLFSPVNLDIKFTPEKTWKRLLFKSELNAKKNKKNFNVKFYERSARVDALIKIQINKNVSCNLKAKIRPHGLFDDHRDGTYILPSLNVELKDGNIFGITKFVLFRPKTRNYDNEIISTLFFQHAGFLAPRTTNAYVKYNNQKAKFIFQEAIAKEFLEINDIKEAPIYEGTTKNFLRVKNSPNINLQNIKLEFIKHRVINEKMSIKSNNHMEMSKTGLSILNNFIEYYIPNRQIYGEGLNSDYRDYEKKFLKTNYFENLPAFDSLSVASRSEHSLSINDRVFYYDPLYSKFIPIHWDGMSYLVDRFNNAIRNERYNVTLTQSIKTGSKKASKILENIDRDGFEKSLILHNVYLKKKDISSIFQIIENNLNKLSNYPDSKIVSLQETKLKKKENKNLVHREHDNYKFVYEDEDLVNYNICNIFNEDCSENKFTQEETSKLIKSNLKIDENNLIYTSKIKKKNGDYVWLHNETKTQKNKLIKEKNLEFILNGEIDYNINWNKQLIEFNKISEYGNIVFKNKNISNWKIIFRNMNSNTPQEKLDKFNLTGCLNFYDVKLNNVSIEALNSNCEDAINFVRSEGLIKDIKIYGSEFDSIDADFSNLTFQNIFVENSKNDCLDFSYGKYKIDFANVSYCGDKGVSAGEITELYIRELNVEVSETGVASKDLSKVVVEKGSVKNSKFCAQAYNKKQEFYGGFINFKILNCENYSTMTKIDNLSLITRGIN